MEDFKEKYKEVCNIKDVALNLVDMQINGNVEHVNAKELGEVMDIAKDAAELIKYMEEACYYSHITKSIDDASDEEKTYYMNKYIPEYGGKFYTPIYNPVYKDGYMKPDMDHSYRNRMYYSSVGNRIDDVDNNIYGKSHMYRRTYMDMKNKGEEKSKTTKELENYMNELGYDMAEMIGMMDSDEKSMLKQKLATLASKIV